MSSALGGTVMPSASSTARTEASACTVVHTPQTRSVKAQASRGSRPFRMISKPRTMVPASRRPPPSVLDLDLDAQVPLDAGDRIDDNALPWRLLLWLRFGGLVPGNAVALAHVGQHRVRAQATGGGADRQADLSAVVSMPKPGKLGSRW
jgi:hypothetical protein